MPASSSEPPSLAECRPHLWSGLTDELRLNQFARRVLGIREDRPLDRGELRLLLTADWLTGIGWTEGDRDDGLRQIAERLTAAERPLVLVADGSLLACSGESEYYDVRNGGTVTGRAWAWLCVLDVEQIETRLLQRIGHAHRAVAGGPGGTPEAAGG